jgi:C4-dicarboxylate-specific signal transduction histidine kinase
MAPVGSATGVMVRRVLAGEPVSSIPIQAFKSDLNLFDARELRRWRIDERRLPANAIVRFRAPSLWRDYRNEVLGVSVALALQSLLIVGLLYQRRARRRAEIDSRRSLALAADANRRVTMSAMTASLAHELNQPLSSILHNAQAGEKLLTSSRATPETLREILSDIVSEDARAAQIVDRHRAMLRHHQIDMKPIDIHAVVRESVAVVSHELTGRRIQADADSPAEACVVAGDHVLLQQVFVNLLMNAMDAMADARPDRRRIAVRSTATRDGVEVSVRDRGTGLPAAIDGRVFEPFVTTKPHGLGIGLTIARTIVEAHGGTMDARNNADGGATFTVTLPRAHTS